ncbi:MAG: collagen-binding domain-containing protein [Ilumatobacteraceae bacterium]|nr:collagen-binding domain-containing protein [Ilumatobacteraceae bacterium]
MTNHRPARRPDEGFTFVEVVVTIVVIGLMSSVIAAAIIVILRNGDGVVSSTSESHDTQQIVSYVPLDVASGPSRADAYRAATGGAAGDRGSGCDDVGNENVLRIDVTDRRLTVVDRRIAYQIVSTGETARIDRLVCEFDGTTWNSTSVLNVADALDGTASPIAEATVLVSNPAAPIVDQQVTGVEVRYVQRGDVETIQAAPREELPLSSSGVCGPDPLGATKNIDTFIEGDVHLDGTAVKSSLYVGGTLTFEGEPDVAQSNANPPDLGPGSPYNNVGLFANSVGWSASSGTLRVRSGTDAVVQDGNYVGGSSGPISEAGGTPRISLQGSGGQIIAPVGTDLPVPPGAAFIELRSCSDRMAALPDSCKNGACASHVGLPTGYPGTASAGGPQLDLTLVPNQVNVLNLEEANLLDLESIQLNFPPSQINQNTPVVINVGSQIGGTITFNPPTLVGIGSASVHVVWNFPNADVVNVVAGAGASTVDGTIMAPYSVVTSTISIKGGVIASEFYMSGSSLNASFSFEGIFGW